MYMSLGNLLKKEVVQTAKLNHNRQITEESESAVAEEQVSK